jgi:hypothetical protein
MLRSLISSLGGGGTKCMCARIAEKCHAVLRIVYSTRKEERWGVGSMCAGFRRSAAKL